MRGLGAKEVEPGRAQCQSKVEIYKNQHELNEEIN